MTASSRFAHSKGNGGACPPSPVVDLHRDRLGTLLEKGSLCAVDNALLDHPVDLGETLLDAGSCRVSICIFSPFFSGQSAGANEIAPMDIGEQPTTEDNNEQSQQTSSRAIQKYRRSVGMAGSAKVDLARDGLIQIDTIDRQPHGCSQVRAAIDFPIL